MPWLPALMAAAIAVALLVLTGPVAALGSDYWAPKHLHNLHIAKQGCRKGEEIQFDSKLATTPEKRKKGLSGHTRLREKRSMLFLWDNTAARIMTMQETAVGLDILFLDRNGRIFQIEAQQLPYAKIPVISNWPARAVLEIKIGLVKKHGIQIGDHVIHESFPNAVDCS